MLRELPKSQFKTPRYSIQRSVSDAWLGADDSSVVEDDGSNIYTQLVTIFGILCVAAAGVALGAWATQGFRL